MHVQNTVNQNVYVHLLLHLCDIINIDARDQKYFWPALADISHDRKAWRAVVNADIG